MTLLAYELSSILPYLGVCLITKLISPLKLAEKKNWPQVFFSNPYTPLNNQKQVGICECNLKNNSDWLKVMKYKWGWCKWSNILENEWKYWKWLKISGNTWIWVKIVENK